MSRFYFILLFCLVVSGCSAFEPYVDRKRNAGQPIERLYVGASTPENPAVCYNALTTTPKEVMDLAINECIKHKTGTTVVPVSQTSWSCGLFSPSRAYFSCM